MPYLVTCGLASKTKLEQLVRLRRIASPSTRVQAEFGATAAQDGGDGMMRLFPMQKSKRN
jgi:hypothetical protein